MKKAVLALATLATLVATPSPSLARAPGAQRFRIVYHDTTGPVAASGVINGGGKVSNVVPEVIDFGAGTFTETDRFTFRRGTLDVAITGNVHDFAPGARSCVSHPSGSGTFTVVGGTGRYAGATGSGTFTFHAILIFGRTGGTCREEPKISTAVVDARGTLALA